jgi:hypothetical protein
VRAVALMPVGLPDEVERGQQGRRAAALRLFGGAVQAGVVEHLIAVDRDHQRGRVGHHDRVIGLRRVDAARLFGCNRGLLVTVRRAAVPVAELAQVFGDDDRIAALRDQCGCDVAAQGGLAGALGAEQRDHGAALRHAALLVRASAVHAFQPATDSAMKTA